MRALKLILRFIAAVLGAASVLLGLGVPVGVLSLCLEGCIDPREQHWFAHVTGLGLMAFGLCASCLLLSAVLFFYARYGTLREDKGRPSATK